MLTVRNVVVAVQRFACWLRCGVAAIMVCALASLAFREVAAADDLATLRWLNGDELQGSVVSATRDRLTWSSPALAHHISVDFRSLDSITATPAAEPRRPAGPYQCLLTNGDLVAGSLRRITPEIVQLDSPRHGVVNIDRSWIARIKRFDAVDAIDLVASQGQGWQSIEPIRGHWKPYDEVHADWKMDDAGQVSTETAGARLFLSTPLPDVCQIELVIECTVRPAFSFSLGSINQLKQHTGDLQLETWGDELVAHSASNQGNFQRVRQLAKDPERLHLYLAWNRASGRLSVYGERGRHLVNAMLGQSTASGAGGVVLENKGSNLTIKRLRINHWIGSGSSDSDIAKDWVRATDGTVLSGRVTGFDSERGLVMAATDGRENRLPAERLADIVFAESRSSNSSTTDCQLEINDGTKLQGELLSVANNVANLAVEYSERPIPVRLAGMTSWAFPQHESRPRHSSQYVLKYGGSQLHGILAAAGAGFGWRPEGSDDAIPLETGTPWQIERVDDAGRPERRLPTGLDVIHLCNGDQFPGRVHTIDQSAVTLKSNISQVGRIPQSAVKAIEFGAETLSGINGFLDQDWKIVGNQPQVIQRKPDRVVFRGQAQISHPRLLEAGMFEFGAQWTKGAQTVLMISLTPGEEIQAGRRQMFYLILREEQIVVHTMDSRMVRQQNIQVPVANGNSLHLQFQFTGSSVEMSVNKEVVGSLPWSDAASPPAGVTISCQQINNRGQGNNTAPLLMISNLSARRASGLLRSAAIRESEHEFVVTVPRSRRNRPPTHVLVASNGDLLRGELVALGPTSAQFRSRFEEITVPRDRLAGIVWLSEEESEFITTKPSAGNVQATFASGIVLEFSPKTIVNNQIVGVHPLLGECQFSLDTIQRLRSMTPDATVSTSAFAEWTLVPAPEPVIPDPTASPTFGTHSELVGKQAEDFELELLDGTRFQLSEHRDKVVVLDFWTTWCGPCIQALPHLIKATSKYSSKDVIFVAVNQQENSSVIQKFLDDHEWDFTVALDEEGLVGQKYELEGFPQTVVVGRGGRIEHVRLGHSPSLESELSETIDALLEQGR